MGNKILVPLGVLVYIVDFLIFFLFSEKAKHSKPLIKKYNGIAGRHALFRPRAPKWEWRIR